MTFAGRAMSGFIQVDYDAIEDDEMLHDWIAYAETFVRTLPPK
jgi:hypothetical protein